MKIRLKQEWIDGVQKIGAGYYYADHEGGHYIQAVFVDEVIDYGDDPDDGMAVIDRDGDAWQRCDGLWEMAGTSAFKLTWDQLNVQYGPVTRLVKVPAEAPKGVSLLSESVWDSAYGVPSHAKLNYRVDGARNVKSAMRELGAYLLHTYSQ